MKNYVYIFIRKDLEPAQKIVQASHVALEVARTNILKEHPSIILIGVKNHQDCLNKKASLENKGFIVTPFYDTLFHNEMTALGVLTSSEEERILLKKYQLYKENNTSEKIACRHPKTKLDLIESIAFEYTPKRICCDCGHVLGKPLTHQEKKQAIKTFYKNILEKDIQDLELEQKIDGFNL